MNADHSPTRFQCPIDPRSNLPVALAKTSCHQGGCNTESSEILDPSAPCSSCHRHAIATLYVLDKTNQNLTSAQKDLLLWHFRLGHMGFAHLQQLMRPRPADPAPPATPSSPSSAESCITSRNPSTCTCPPPLCSACQLARARRRSTEVSTTTVHQEALLKTQHLVPGVCVSIDQYESSVRGRLPNSRGKESFGLKYCGGTIFCDHASGYVQAFHQVSLRTADTLISKRAFERIAQSCGVRVDAYHGDNGTFKSQDFADSLVNQELTFSGTGAHHQSGVAERNIQTVTEKARVMMQHSFLHWPEEFQVDLWPFALDCA